MFRAVRWRPSGSDAALMRKRRGHFCWCCGRVRANERFSGRGHANHVCKDCQKLGAKELAFQQIVRDIDRLFDHFTGRLKRNQPATFAPYRFVSP